MRFFKFTLPTVLASLLSAPALAHEAGDVLVRFGLLTTQPDIEDSELLNREVDLGDDTQVGFSGAYMFTEYLAVELMASTPGQHNIFLDGDSGSGLVGETGRISPAALVQFHMPTVGDFDPYVGVGVNYTAFFEEGFRDNNARGVPADRRLEMGSSTGLVGQVGVDMALGADWSVNGAVTHMDIDTTATVKDGNGSTVEKSDITLDPLMWQVGITRRF